jgi:hypothetical protein
MSINVLQQSKTREYLSGWKARPGHKLVQFDLCLHPDTEILTKARGWVKILDLSPLDFVWQVNPTTLKGSWTVPTQHIRLDYDGPMYTFKTVRGQLSVTANHKMLWAGQRNHPRKDKALFRKVTYSQDGVQATNLHMITSTTSDLVSNYSTEEIWQVCALQADSTYTKYKSYVVQVARERKIAKMRELFGQETSSKPRLGKLTPHIWCGIKFSSPLLNCKTFNLESLGSNQVEEFVQALTFWDGNKEHGRRISYTTTDRITADQVQIYLTRSGYECKITEHKAAKATHSDFYTLSIKRLGDIRLRSTDVSSTDYKGLVGCVTVPDGFIFVRSQGQCFVTGNCAIEPVVLAEYSQDPTLMRLYGPNAKPNDVYLYNAAHISVWSKLIREVYDPLNPTPESLSLAKKQFKTIRSVSKVVHLAKQYGAGSFKIYQTLLENEIVGDDGKPLPRSTVDTICADWDELYSGIKQFEQKLLGEWEFNRGWIYNGVYRPICVHESMVKDILNRYCQSTGHDILLLMLRFINQERKARGIKMYPWICDYHDETIWEVEERDAERAMQLFKDAFKFINETLKPVIPIKGSFLTCDNLADIKCE